MSPDQQPAEPRPVFLRTFRIKPFVFDVDADKPVNPSLVLCRLILRPQNRNADQRTAIPRIIEEVSIGETYFIALEQASQLLGTIRPIPINNARLQLGCKSHGQQC